LTQPVKIAHYPNGKLSEMFCAVLCTTVVHNDMHARTHLSSS